MSSDEMRPEYDFTGGVRGKYAQRFDDGNNLVRLASDLAAEFPTSEAVEEALRWVLKHRGTDLGLHATPKGL